MKIVQRSINDLIFAEYNPRELTPDQHQQLKDSLTRFGVVDPVIINTHKDRKDIIVGGHQRTKVWKEMGNKEIPTVEVKLNPEKERELNIRLNKNSGQWDEQALQENFNTEELIEWGFDNSELEFFKPEITEGLTDDDEIPEVEESITKQGDLWILGEHRVLCGDATKIEDVERLMDGEKADMVFTSPPYNANMNMIIYEKGKVKSTPFYENNETDNKSSKEFIDFLSSVLNNCIINTDGWIFWNIGYNANSRCEWIENTNDFKDYLQETIIWKKSSAMPVKYGFTRIIEFIFLYSTKGNKSHINKESQTIQNFWEVSNNNSSIENHKACFPIELVSKALNINNDNKLILEPFCGSGSTLIAAEKLNRKCYGMEIDPHYCDVIIKRWENYTGLKAEKINELELA